MTLSLLEWLWVVGVPLIVGAAVLRWAGLARGLDRLAWPGWAWLCGTLVVAAVTWVWLLLGKPVGIALFSWLAVRFGLAVLPRGVNWRSILATGVLAGIGFTVALFVTALAFTDPVATAGSKIGILVGSLFATLIGLAILLQALPRAGQAD